MAYGAASAGRFRLARRSVKAKDPIDWQRLGLVLLLALVAVAAVASLVWIAFTPT